MATPAAVRTATASGTPTNPLALLGRALWRLATSVDVAVAQIVFLSILAAIGMTLQQLPDFAYRSPTDYATAIESIHIRYDPVLGPGLVNVLERLGAFGIFKSAIFGIGLVVLVTSIVVCTLDRTPKLWREVSAVRVVQPEPFFDPRLPDRAVMSGVDAGAVAAAFKRRGFHVREAPAADGVTHLYGDRHRYTKLATLLTHLGLVLFLVAAAVTSRFGDEQGLVVPEGESLTVQSIGTRDLLLVKNLDFAAPGFETGQPTDFTTDLAVYQNGAEVARKTIRVNDPLSIDGYTFHQNGFGPAPHILIRDATGAPLWDAKVPMTGVAGGVPYETMAVPGRDVGLQMLLGRNDVGEGFLIVLPYRILGTNADGTDEVQNFDPLRLQRGDEKVAQQLGISIALADFGEYTLLIAKRDPGQGIVWAAFLSLIAGITITFYRPRRRVWARLAPDGRLGLVFRADRYVDVEREFGALLDDLVVARRPSP
ncbi:MAG TPA: cytochrome c biogenesis protein ResB [Candidatus Limnocylindrales bacterium]|nr:cytochrome c biogenesis protein ResB [Candidatus Limnocylindrales bacterium]